VMRCRHESCQGWVAKDGIVRQRDVGDVEVEAFCPVVVPGAEGDGQANLPDGLCRTLCYSEERPGWHEPVIWHLHLLEDFDRDDVEARPSIDESVVDGDVIDSGRAQERNCADGPGGDRMVLLVEADPARRPPQSGAIYAWLCYRDLPRQLLEVAIRWRSLSSSQEASGEASRLLIAPWFSSW
jgi:hypothetical protein